MYISGNVRNPFEYYMVDPTQRSQMDWRGKANYPRPDYLSSSRKRLVPQLMFKSGILNAWAKKTAVALHKAFYETLPPFEEVDKSEADLAWLIYDLKHHPQENKYTLESENVIYTKFHMCVTRISTPEPGGIQEFVEQLQAKLDEKLEEGHPPETETIESPF